MNGHVSFQYKKVADLTATLGKCKVQNTSADRTLERDWIGNQPLSSPVLIKNGKLLLDILDTLSTVIFNLSTLCIATFFGLWRISSQFEVGEISSRNQYIGHHLVSSLDKIHCIY